MGFPFPVPPLHSPQPSPNALIRKRSRAASRSEILKRQTRVDGLIWATRLDFTQFDSVRTVTLMYFAAAAGLRYPGLIVALSFLRDDRRSPDVAFLFPGAGQRSLLLVVSFVLILGAPI